MVSDVYERDVFAYESKKVRWDLVGSSMDRYMYLDSYCEIDNVWYFALQGRFL